MIKRFAIWLFRCTHRRELALLAIEVQFDQGLAGVSATAHADGVIDALRDLHLLEGK